MKNILDENPETDIRGRLRFSTHFVGGERCRGADILDIGCGFGWFERFALEHGAKSIVGVEPGDADLEAVRGFLTDPRASFHAASALELPFPADAFDVVVMWEVLEHLPTDSEPRAFAEIARVLKPGGRLFLSTPHATPIAEATDPARWLIGHRHYKSARVRDFILSAGLEVERLELRGGVWEIASINMLYVCKWVFRRKPFFENGLRNRADAEWNNREGFTNIVLEARRP